MNTEEKRAPKRMPKTRSVNPKDPKFLDWLQQQRESQGYIDAASMVTPTLMPAAIPGDGGDGGDDNGGGGGGGGGGAPQPLQSFHAYANRRPNVDWNTCGQAAIGSMADFHHRNPYSLPRNASGFWSDGAIIDAVKAGGYPPDVIFGWGTSGDRIRNALSSYGLYARKGNSGLFFSGWQVEWNTLLQYVYYFGSPTPVLVDLGLLGGPAWTAHWAIAWRMDYTSSGMLIRLANCSWAPTVSQTQFLDAWACRQLPLGFNHCGVYCSA